MATPELLQHQKQPNRSGDRAAQDACAGEVAGPAVSPWPGPTEGQSASSSTPSSSIAGDAASMLAAQLVTMAAGLAASIVLARLLGPTGRGLFALVTLWVSLFALAVPLSSGYGLVYEVRQSRLPLDRALSAVLGLALAFGVPAVVLAVAAGWVFSFSFLGGVPLAYIVIGALGLPAAIFNALAGLVLTAAGRVRQASIISAMGSVGTVVLLAVFLFGLRLGVWGAMLATCLAACAAALLLLVWLRRFFRARLLVHRALWTSAIRFGSKLHAGTIAQWLNYSLDRFLLNIFLGPAAVGIYAVAAGLGERLWMLPNAVGASLLSRTGGDARDDAEVTARACRNTLWLMGATSAVVGALAPTLIPALFGRDFAPAVPVLLLLLPGVFILTVGKVIAPFVCNRGRPTIATYISVGALGLTLALNLLLIPALGIAGAALASSISYSANGLAFAVVFLRMSGLPARQLLRAPDLAISLLGAQGRKLLSAGLAKVCYDRSL